MTGFRMQDAGLLLRQPPDSQTEDAGCKIQDLKLSPASKVGAMISNRSGYLIH